MPTAAQTRLPFFDDRDNPVAVQNGSLPADISPPAPPFEPFDRKLLALCGSGFDASVDPASFRRLLSYYPDVVHKLKAVTNGEIKPDRRSDTAFLTDLTEIWFNQQGFKHIFCGEKKWEEKKQRYSIGGLHFHARYLQLQQEGVAERITATTIGTREDAIEEVVPGVIYTFGVGVREGGQLTIQHPIKGYAYVLNAQELLIYTTQAFKQFVVPANAPRSSGCLFTVSDRTVPPFPPETVTFQAMMFKRANAIITFYPDATPDTRLFRPCNQPI
jgi:hypothetical protein